MANDEATAGATHPALTRTTVNLTAHTTRDLDNLAAATGLNRTDLINKAVRLFAHLHPHLETGAVTILRPDGSHDRLFIL
jgi:hypothetical protein